MIDFFLEMSKHEFASDRTTCSPSLMAITSTIQSMTPSHANMAMRKGRGQFDSQIKQTPTRVNEAKHKENADPKKIVILDDDVIHYDSSMSKIKLFF